MSDVRSEAVSRSRTVVGIGLLVLFLGALILASWFYVVNTCYGVQSSYERALEHWSHLATFLAGLVAVVLMGVAILLLLPRELSEAHPAAIWLAPMVGLAFFIG